MQDSAKEEHKNGKKNKHLNEEEHRKQTTFQGQDSKEIDAFLQNHSSRNQTEIQLFESPIPQQDFIKNMFVSSNVTTKYAIGIHLDSHFFQLLLAKLFALNLGHGYKERFSIQILWKYIFTVHFFATALPHLINKWPYSFKSFTMETR